MSQSEVEQPSILKTALFFGLAFPTILLLTVLIIWVAGKALPYFDIEIDQAAIAFITPMLIAIGISYGLGVAYGCRPDEKRGVINIWLFSIFATIVFAYSLIKYAIEALPEQWTRLDIVIAITFWLIFTALLACVGLSKRHEIIKEAIKKTLEA